MTIFESTLTTFEASFIFWGSWGSIKNWLELKIEPPLADLALLNPWNTQYQISFLPFVQWLPTGCRGTLGCRKEVSGVPPNLELLPFYWCFTTQGAAKLSFLSNQGCHQSFLKAWRVPRIKKGWKTLLCWM
jgi:hypothetical protein